MAVNDLVVVNAGIPHTETSQDGSPMAYVEVVFIDVHQPGQLFQGEVFLEVVVDIAPDQAAFPARASPTPRPVRTAAPWNTWCWGWRGWRPAPTPAALRPSKLIIASFFVLCNSPQ